MRRIYTWDGFIGAAPVATATTTLTSAGGSGDDWTTAITASRITAVASPVFHGTRAGRFLSPADANASYVVWGSSSAPLNSTALAVQDYFVLQDTPTAQVNIIQVRNATGGAAHLALTPTRTLLPLGTSVGVNNTITTYGTGSDGQASPPLVIGRKYRVDFSATQGAGNGRVRTLLVEHDTGAVVYEYDSGAASNTGSTSFQEVRLGKTGSLSSLDIVFDTVRLEDRSSAFLAPFVVVIPVKITASASPTTVSTGQSSALTSTATNGTGTRAFEWTRASGPGGTFSAPSSASTSWTPNASGVNTLQVTVTDGQDTDSAVVTVDAIGQVTFPTVDLVSGATAVGGSASAVLSDTNDATYIADGIVDLTLPRVEPIVGDLEVTIRDSRGIDAPVGELGLTLRDGATTVATATVDPASASATPGDRVVTFPAAAISSVSDAKWLAGTLKIRSAEEQAGRAR